MSNRGSAARGARAKNAGGPKGPEAQGHSPYGYAHMDWLAREDPEYARARGPLSVLSIGEGKELSVKHREMIIIGILAFRGRQDGVVAHMRRAIEHGATKRELLEAIQSAAVPGGGPTLSSGLQALMELERAGVFRKS
jgi:alkylhydroperoxidase/carboxymuconolactone decarboxylase family protein YurZ